MVMDFIYEIEQKTPLAIACSVAGMEMSGTHSGDDLTNVQYKPI
jgi:hypothetical protein